MIRAAVIIGRGDDDHVEYSTWDGLKMVKEGDQALTHELYSALRAGEAALRRIALEEADRGNWEGREWHMRHANLLHVVLLDSQS